MPIMIQKMTNPIEPITTIVLKSFIIAPRSTINAMNIPIGTPIRTNLLSEFSVWRKYALIPKYAAAKKTTNRKNAPFPATSCLLEVTK